MPCRRDANLIDRHVGDCIRMRRISLGFSQQKLAGHVGVTFQQVQKYERGKSRISASRLYEIAMVLGMTPGDFFNGLPPEDGTRAAVHDIFDYYDTVSPQFGRRELVELNEAFCNIASPELRRAILELMQELCRKELLPTVTGKTAQSGHRSQV